MIKKCTLCGLHLIPGPDVAKHMFENHFTEVMKHIPKGVLD